MVACLFAGSLKLQVIRQMHFSGLFSFNGIEILKAKGWWRFAVKEAMH